METALISLRIPKAILASIDEKARNLKRSRAWVIVDALENTQAKKVPSDLPTVSNPQKSANPRIRAVSEPSKVKACPECFALNGMHQRGCKNG